jgi:hypothetical protein
MLWCLSLGRYGAAGTNLIEGCPPDSPLFCGPPYEAGQTNTNGVIIKTPRGRRFAVFLKQIRAALSFCGTDWAIVAFTASHEQEAIKCVTIAFIILRPGGRRPATG